MNPTLALAAILTVVVATVVIGGFGLRISRTTDDFLVASRTVGPWWNASAISGEYLSAASFLGIAGLVLLSGSHGFWFPIGYCAGYLILLVLVAAPLRRSGARTLPDFLESRLDSGAVRRVASLVVVLVGWLYILPQLHGAALAVEVATGLPAWVGAVGVAVVVTGVVAAGGMRAITFVQAFHYWLKLTALGVPLVFLLLASGAVAPSAPPAEVFPAELGPAGGDPYGSASLLLALLLGTMGLPHVLVRFYTSPEGGSARRTTIAVIALTGVFYAVASTMGLLARAFAPDLAAAGTADSVVLLLPMRLIPGPVGIGLTALVVAGAFAAFLSTSSGLAVSLAGVISQDVLGGGVRAFRIAALLAMIVPLALSFVTVPNGLTSSVGLVFVVAASSISPVIVLAVWWPGLTARGAAAGMVVGALACGVALALDAAAVFAGPSGAVGGAAGGGAGDAVTAALRMLVAQPAAWTAPLAFAVTILVSRFGRRRPPADALDRLRRLHRPEA